MSVDEATSLPDSLGVTEEMMACPLPRLPFVEPDDIPEELKEELTPLYDWSKRMWGTVPRFLQLLGNSPPTMEGWMLLDQKLRTNRLKTESDYIRLMELVIVKTAILTECNN